MTDTESPGRSWTAAWLQWALVFFLFVACALFVDYREVSGILRRASIGWFFAALVLAAADRLLMAWKWSILLRALAVEVPFSTLVRTYFQATLAAIFLPTSLVGDLLRGHWISQESQAAPRVYASVVMEKGIGLLSSANWALLGGTILLGVKAPARRETWVAVALAALLALNLGFWALMRPRVHSRILLLLASLQERRLVDLMHRFYEALAQYGRENRALLLNGFLTIMEHGLQMVIFLLLALSLGIESSPLLFLSVAAIHLLVYRLPISPDGWGVGELTAIGLYGLIGISAEDAFSLAFLGHVTHLIVALPGLWFLLRSSLKVRG